MSKKKIPRGSKRAQLGPRDPTKIKYKDKI